MDQSTVDQVREILIETLQLEGDAARLEADSPLIGHLPQLDSMGVVSVMTALEERLGIQIADDEIDAEAFETLGALSELVDAHRDQ